MDKILRAKLFFIIIYVIIAISYFYDEYFPTFTGTIHTFTLLQIVVVAVSFGVILSASIYNIALFIYLQNLQYLYYALAQLSSLFFLIMLDSLYISPFDELFKIQSIFLFDLSQLFMLLFSLLFLKYFFHSYRIHYISTIIHAIFYLIAIDFIISLFVSHTIIIRFVPIFIFILLVISEAYRQSQKRDLPLNLVFIGWLIVLFIATGEYFGLLKVLNIIFPFLHVSIALESVILSFALAYKIKLISQEQEEQQTLLLQQSRLASMGEMISSITHQWRQPLNVISFGLMTIRASIKDKDNLFIMEKLDEQLQYMSTTVEDFRNFYNPSKEKEFFSVYEASQKASIIANSSLDSNDIKITINLIEDFTIYGHINELEQVMLTIINNAKDAFNRNQITNPMLSISIKNRTITIQDNAGGINRKVIGKIFNRYFSTKKDSDGLGLYIAKLIIEKEMNGIIKAYSFYKRTAFILKFN